MAKPLNRPFRQLRALKKKPAAPREAVEPSAPESFSEVVRADGVLPVVPVRARVAPEREPAQRVVPRVVEREHAFSVRVDLDCVEARRDDVEAAVFPWLARQEPTAKLDLHGKSAEQARRDVHRFVRARAKRGDEVVLLVTGKGSGAKGAGVIRREAPEWLVERAMHTFVRAFATAPRDLGGHGALLVWLDPRAR